MFTVLCKKACAETSCCRPLLTVGMSKAETVEFVFSAEWEDLTKTAVFTDGTVTVDVLQPSWLGNTVTIPAEVLTTAGRYVRVGVYGSNADGVALPTIWADLGKVRPGAEQSGDASTDPSLPVWAQLQALIGDLDDLTTKAKDNLVAAINEAAKTGSGGSGSIDLRVADGYIQYSNDDGTTWENLIAVADLKGEDGAPGTPGTPGKDGTNGQDGYSPSASVSETDTGATITITDKTGTTTAEIKNGKDGKDGEPGEKGDTGSPGAKGDPGATPNLQIGTVETLPAGSDATASVSGTAENPLLNLGIPKGADGSGGSGGTDLSLGMTSAAVGQLAKVTAVDADGKPTAWEPVDMPSGGASETWELINRSVVPAETTKLTITQDQNGQPFAFYELKYVIQVAIPSDKKDAVIWFSCRTKTERNASVTINGATENQTVVGYASSLGGFVGGGLSKKVEPDSFSYAFADTVGLSKLSIFQMYASNASLFLPEGSKVSLYGRGK